MSKKRGRKHSSASASWKDHKVSTSVSNSRIFSSDVILIMKCKMLPYKITRSGGKRLRNQNHLRMRFHPIFHRGRRRTTLLRKAKRSASASLVRVGLLPQPVVLRHRRPVRVEVLYHSYPHLQAEESDEAPMLVSRDIYYCKVTSNGAYTCFTRATSLRSSSSERAQIFQSLRSGTPSNFASTILQNAGWNKRLS